MDTQNLNITPENGGTDNKSENTSKAKKVAGKVAQLAGAAGIGVAGTMAAHAMNSKDKVHHNENTSSANSEEVEEVVVEVAEEATTHFDPNDIMIEDVEEVEVDPEMDETLTAPLSENQHENLAMTIEPEPITGEDTVIEQDDVAIIDIDNLDLNDSEEIPDYIDGEGDGWDENENDNPDVLLADNGIDENPDILNDILNA